MVRNEEKEEAIAKGEDQYILSKELDMQMKKGAEQLAEIIKDPRKVERIQKIIEFELSGEIGELTHFMLREGISAAADEDAATSLILMSIETQGFVDWLPELDISEDVLLAFLKDLNLLYGRKAELAFNYSERKEDWINSRFELATTDEGLQMGMYLVKGSGEIVHIEGPPSTFLNLLGKIIGILSEQELTDELSEEDMDKFEKDVNTLINKLKGKESEDSG